jgi:hypothetical protein
MTIFTCPQWCIEPLRPHDKGGVSADGDETAQIETTAGECCSCWRRDVNEVPYAPRRRR